MNKKFFKVLINKVWLLLIPSLITILSFTDCCKPQVLQDIIDEIASTFGEPVEVSETDTSPPAISLEFNHPTSGQRVLLRPGDQPMIIIINPQNRFFVVADDPEGVKDVRFGRQVISRTILFFCRLPFGNAGSK